MSELTPEEREEPARHRRMAVPTDAVKARRAPSGAPERSPGGRVCERGRRRADPAGRGRGAPGNPGTDRTQGPFPPGEGVDT